MQCGLGIDECIVDLGVDIVTIQEDDYNVKDCKKGVQTDKNDLQFSLSVVVDGLDGGLWVLQYTVGLVPLEEESCLYDSKQECGYVSHHSVPTF